MTTAPRNRNKGRNPRLYGLTGILLMFSLAIFYACSSSSDTRTKAKESISGTYQILAKILSPVDGAIIAFKADGTSDVTYTHTVTGGTEPYGVTWLVVGPTTRNTASGDSPTITFFETGEHTVTLTVSDAKGLTATDRITITISRELVTSEALVVRITAPSSNQTIGLGDAITYSGSVSGGSGTYSFNWNIPGGDTTTSTTTSTTTADDDLAAITYNRVGTYTTTLTVVDSWGNTGSATVTITVVSSTVNIPLQADITSPAIRTSFDINEAITFTVNASGGSGNYAYLWKPGTTTNVDKQRFETATGTFTFTAAGTYTATVTVKDTTFGNSTTNSVTVTVK